MESILNYIEKNIERNGKLSKDFTLAPYKNMNPNAVNFADGAEDGIRLYHMKTEPDQEIIDEIIDLIKQVNEDNIEQTCVAIDKLYEEKSIKTFHNINSIIHGIKENADEINLDAMLKFSICVVVNTRNVEMMKLGIVVLGMINISENKLIVELIQKIALSDELTLYANYAIEAWDNANDVRFMLAKKVEGWGKIHLVSTLEVTSENIREWLITEGCKNDVDLGYLANVVAHKINLTNVLRRNNLNKRELNGISEIMEGLLEEGPCEGIEEFENYIEILELYIDKFKSVIDDINFYHIPVVILEFLSQKNLTPEEQEIVTTIQNLIESSNAVQTLKQAIKSGDMQQFGQALKVISFDKNIELSDDIFEAFSQSPFERFYAFEHLLKTQIYKEKAIELMEKSQNFEQHYENPKPILWNNNEYSTNLIFIIQMLSGYPFVCSNIVAAGLMSKTMQPRNAALNTIKNWVNISKKNIEEFPPIIYSALQKLQKTEIIKSYKERINNLLGIQEDLSNYKEPEIVMNESEENEINIDLFSDDLENIFEPQIRFRGKDYFENNMIYSCIQKENKYTAYVQGTEFGKEYQVEIKLDGTMVKNINCNCPYQNNCKHEYATILWLRREIKK